MTKQSNKYISRLLSEMETLKFSSCSDSSKISKIYAMAGEYYRLSKDKKFTVYVYKKAINWCYRINNTSKLHLLGQSMDFVDDDGDNYFELWGEQLKKEAKSLSDGQKIVKSEKYKKIFNQAAELVDNEKDDKAMKVYMFIYKYYPYDEHILCAIEYIHLKRNNYAEAEEYHKKRMKLGYENSDDFDWIYKDKFRKIKEKYMKTIECVYDTQKSNKVDLSKKKLIKKIKGFFKSNTQMKKGEVFYVVKAFIDEDNKVQSYGAYYGAEINPLSLLVNSDDYSDEVFLAEAISKKAMLEFIGKSKNNEQNENIYAFKILYQDFNLLNVESFYGGIYDLDLYMFEHNEEVDNPNRKMLKQLGKVTYTPSLNFYMD